MDYRYLGKTGLRFSKLCLGAMTFGRETSQEIWLADTGNNMVQRFSLR